MTLDEIEQRFERAQVDALTSFGEEVVADIRDEIGHDYPPSSQPGQPPKRRTGELQDGITADVETFVDSSPELRITSTAPHTPYVEASRPFLAPAREKWGQVWRETAKDRIQQAMSNNG